MAPTIPPRTPWRPKNARISENSGRDSNFELLRIISMLFIIAHHYVVNSGLLSASGPILANPLSGKSLFLLVFGAWGKTAINCFILITGYFMCKSAIRPIKLLKLYIEREFYTLAFYLIFLLTGRNNFSIKEFVWCLIPFSYVADDFIPCYLLLYLTIPFLNLLISHMNQKQHLLLCALGLTIYSVIGTIPTFYLKMNYYSWFIVLYFVAAYIRLYPQKWFHDSRRMGLIFGLIFLATAASIPVMTWIGTRISITNPWYYFVTDVNKLPAFLTALSAFLLFKSLRIRHSKFINTVSASTLGVLLIHANSDAMRTWLWKDTLNNVNAYGSNLFWLHAILSVIGVFTVATLIDWLRRKYLEQPLFNRLHK